MDFIVHHAHIIGLLFFFTFFIGAVIYAYRPSNAKKIQSYAYIPFEEDNHHVR